MKKKLGYIYKLESETVDESLSHYDLKPMLHDSIKEANKQYEDDITEGVFEEEPMQILEITVTTKVVK